MSKESPLLTEAKSINKKRIKEDCHLLYLIDKLFLPKPSEEELMMRTFPKWKKEHGTI